MARSWVLGDTTLPNPNGFQKIPIKVYVQHEASNGRTIRQYIVKKYKYRLRYDKLTQAEVATFLALEEQFDTPTLVATDGSLNIPSTTVHMDIPEELFNAKGPEFREDIYIDLTEVI